ncbi:hypothetical protein SLS57_010146 [Botryosphaeria dothidea]
MGFSSLTSQPINRDFLRIDESRDEMDGRVATALASERTLASVFANPQYADGKAELIYNYDYGDGWGHEIVYLGKANDSFAKRQIGKGVVEGQRTWCVSGEGHPCAEDCGGSRGWEELKQAFASSSDDQVFDRAGLTANELRAWYTTECFNGDHEGLQPWKWDITEVNQKLTSLDC